jgi:pSer/pThr/pTyr-binding forkhead associated (FHA) protein
MAAAAAKLVAHDLGADLPLPDGVALVGRAPECDLRIETRRISRHHCVLAWVGDGLLIRDLGSTNGVLVNGRRVDSGRAKLGDEIVIADLRFTLALVPPAGRNVTDSLIERLEEPVMLEDFEPAGTDSQPSLYNLA